jgi:predicted TIM-barrel fold metal-dependent hydrolase
VAEEIIDIYTLFGPVPPRGGEEGTGRLRALLTRHGVHAAATASTRALYHDALHGNQETRDACAATSDGGGPRLFPAAVLDPRVPSPEDYLQGARLVCLFPATQHWPVNLAPLRPRLRTLSEANVPVLCEVSRLGDATTLATLLDGIGFSAPVVLADIHEEGLAEALAVAGEHERYHIATDRLYGVGEIEMVVSALGAERVLFGSGAPRASMGAALALVRHAAVSEAARAQILGGNARALLGLGGGA